MTFFRKSVHDFVNTVTMAGCRVVLGFLAQERKENKASVRSRARSCPSTDVSSETLNSVCLTHRSANRSPTVSVKSHISGRAQSARNKIVRAFYYFASVLLSLSAER